MLREIHAEHQFLPLKYKFFVWDTICTQLGDMSLHSKNDQQKTIGSLNVAYENQFYDLIHTISKKKVLNYVI